MAGIYIHIPFCKQACYYCDFHFSTSSHNFNEITSAVIKEIQLQRNYLDQEKVSTIYFGGGTPSILPVGLLEKIVLKIHETFPLKDTVEFTLEANPDDLTIEKLTALKELGINRLSIGVQSFQPEILHFLNRVHQDEDAIRSIENSHKSGFENINVDLIYGIVDDGHKSLINDLKILSDLHPTHVSAYCLTIEPKTVFGNWQKKGTLKTVSEEYAADQFELTIDDLEKAGYEQYEVSNFARNQQYSLHNSNYWKGVSYLGIGPSAHSFNGVSRQYNISNNAAYIKSINEEKIPCEREELDTNTRANELIMTGLRTKWGCDLKILMHQFGYNVALQQKPLIEELIKKDLMCVNDEKMFLTKKGLLVADEIIAGFFLV